MNKYQKIACKCAKLTHKKYGTLLDYEARCGRDYLLIFKNNGWNYARIKRFKDFLKLEVENE